MVAYYIIDFQIKYQPGDIYTNLVAQAFSEFTATFVCGLLYKKFGIRFSFSLSYVFAIVGSVSLIMFAEDYLEFVPYFLFLLRVGLNTGLCLVYFVNADVFPTLFTGSAFGICNFFGRGLTILAP